MILDDDVIEVEDVRKMFKSIDTKKALGPDGCSAGLLKNFAHELAPVWQPLFQASIDTHTVPVIWKTAYIKPLPKTPCPKEYKDFRPIALTSVIVKCLERLLLQHLVHTVKDKLDPWQFAYKKGCSTEDAVAALVHIISKHLDKPKTIVRALFLDFSSAFNTVQVDRLVSKLVRLNVNPYLVQWYTSFLTDRVQRVKVNKTVSSAIITNVGVPQGCVSSAILFTLYTDDCRTDVSNQYILKYSDDTVLISVINDLNSPEFHQQGVTKLNEWCENNALVINTSKTEEIVFGSVSDIMPVLRRKLDRLRHINI